MKLCCEQCSKEFVVKWQNQRFCSRSCSATANNPKRAKPVLCLACRTVLPRRNTKYCGTGCQKEYNYAQWEKEYLANFSVAGDSRRLKQFLTRHRGYQCSHCGISKWNGKDLVLDLEHINGDSKDNSPENLELLCPNCHSQTPTYKGRNKGNGRHSRRQRYAEGKSY